MAKLRLISLLLMVAVVLAACGGTPPATNDAAGDTTSSTDTQAPAGPTEASTGAGGSDAVTLTIWDFGGVEFDWIETLAIPKFQEKYPNITIKHLGIPESDYSTKLDTAVAANDVPDIALQSYTYKLWKAGHLLALDEFMKVDGIKVDDFYPIFKSWNMLDGKTYALPVSAYIWAMVYNRDLFKAAGIEEPTTDTVVTYDQWLQWARAINKPSDSLESRVWGSVHFVPNWNSMNNYMSDPYVLGADGKMCEASTTSEAWISTWNTMLTAYNEELVPEASAALISGQDIDLFQQGKLGMTYGNYGDALAAQNAGINVGLTGQPVVTKGWQGNVGSWDDAFGIMTGSKHPQEAWLFLKFLSTEVSKMKADGNCESCGNPPTYRPAAEGWAGTDRLRLDSLKLLERVVPPPASPDVWGATDPFNEAWRRMTEEKTDVAEAVSDAAAECQEILDNQWEQWNSLGQ